MSDFDLFDDYSVDQPATLEEEQPPSPPRVRRTLSLYDVIASLFVLATAGVVAWTVLLIQNPFTPYNPFAPATPEPTATLYSTPVQLADVPPTWTASPSPTNGPSPTPSATATATGTPRPTATGITPAVGATSTAAIFPFTLQDEVVTYARYQGEEGCDWQSIAGQVFALNGGPVTDIPIQVTGDNFQQVIFSGDTTSYGPSGWEVKVSDTPVDGEFTVRLLSTTGMPLSELIVVRTFASCDRNVAVVNFVQNHEISR